MIKEKLESMGITLPEPPSPAGSYTPITRINNTLFVSGQIPFENNKVVFTGQVSDDNLSVAQKSARLCILNILSQLQNEILNLDKIERFVKISGFINSAPDFTMHSKVINGASDLLYEIFGDIARHSRIAVGVPSLPFNSMTEIDAIVQVK